MNSNEGKSLYFRNMINILYFLNNLINLGKNFSENRKLDLSVALLIIINNNNNNIFLDFGKESYKEFWEIIFIKDFMKQFLIKT